MLSKLPVHAADRTNWWALTERVVVQAPLGAVMVGLIYVNPAGPVNADGTRNVDPVAHGQEIREVFGRMGFDDEAVCLDGLQG